MARRNELIGPNQAGRISGLNKRSESVRRSLEKEDYPPYWGPIHYDGVFFAEDARDQLINGDINFNGAITMGSNKFDGSRLWMADYWGWEDGMNPNDIKSIFDVGSRIRALRTTFPGHRTEYRVNTVYSIQCPRICNKDVKLFQKEITKQL